ncbi:hypothetical protein [Lentimicrobium sp. S6]|uniref:hypothetical protein n=1 Tax=Lentimicrobium sp. S6 TaxID=2735872 RepID=UPI00155406C1|nr:hypothetical protein [Lentimicrobium sp. S6]NPD47056.1 hypothetical protein [Lentimicrobium sp. S6]
MSSPYIHNKLSFYCQAKPKYTIFVGDKTHHASHSDVNRSSAPGWVFDFYGKHSSMDFPPLSFPFYYFLKELLVPQTEGQLQLYPIINPETIKYNSFIISQQLVDQSINLAKPQTHKEALCN